jgi:AICAR transformylase/IMP cyclohydrolase PurH
MASHLSRVSRALLSVSDKTGLVDFARALAERGIRIAEEVPPSGLEKMAGVSRKPPPRPDGAVHHRVFGPAGVASHLSRVSRALLSVSDKTGLVDFARALAERGIALVSPEGRHARPDAGS